MKVSRTTVNFFLDCLLLVVFVVLLFVSTVVRFVFPEPRHATEWKLWTWSLDQWVQLQFAVLGVFTLAVLLHVMLHWPWICGVASGWLPRTDDGRKQSPNEGSRTIAGVALLVIILNVLGILIAIAALTMQRPNY